MLTGSEGLNNYIQSLNNTIEWLELKDCFVNVDSSDELIVVVKRGIHQIKIPLDKPIKDVIAEITRAFALVIY